MDYSTSLTRKLPPQNIDAEQSVLGAVLLENEAINKVTEHIIPEDFYRESHRKIFQGMLELLEKNEPVDLITLTDELKKKNHLADVGGPAYIASLADNIPTASNVAYYAKIVREKAILRRLVNTATEIVTKGYEDSGNVEDVLDQAERSIFEITRKGVNPSFFDLKTVVKESFKTIERLYEKKDFVTGVPTGFQELDRLTAGLQPADLIIVAGRPSMGKTALCLNIAQYAASEASVPVAIFSLEMSKEQIALRMLCSEGRVDAQQLRRGFLTDQDWRKLIKAADLLSRAPIFIDDTPAMSVLEMRAKARRLKAEHNLGLIIIDYLQLMRGRSGTDSREQEISDISRSLKALAKELNLPVLALSQLNRRVEERPIKRPQLADLRESGAIEQDADVIAFIYREEVYNRSEENKGKAEVMVGKQRNGPTGDIPLTFIDKYTRFENYSPRAEEY